MRANKHYGKPESKILTEHKIFVERSGKEVDVGELLNALPIGAEGALRELI